MSEIVMPERPLDWPSKAPRLWQKNGGWQAILCVVAAAFSSVGLACGGGPTAPPQPQGPDLKGSWTTNAVLSTGPYTCTSNLIKFDVTGQTASGFSGSYQPITVTCTSNTNLWEMTLAGDTLSNTSINNVQSQGSYNSADIAFDFGPLWHNEALAQTPGTGQSVIMGGSIRATLDFGPPPFDPTGPPLGTLQLNGQFQGLK